MRETTKHRKYGKLYKQNAAAMKARSQSVIDLQTILIAGTSKTSKQLSVSKGEQTESDLNGDEQEYFERMVDLWRL